MKSSRRVLLTTTAALALGGGLASCTTEKMARGEPPQDLSPLKPGISRAEVQALLGSAVRTWRTPAGVEYSFYKYDAGVPGDPAAHFLTLITVLTFGLPELLEAAGAEKSDDVQPKDPARFRNVAVSYDSSGRALGIFRDVSDFAVLPADGLPPGKR